MRLARMSTARPSAGALDSFLLEQLPKGHLLNLGAGGGTSLSNGATVVNVDHVTPTEAIGLYVVGDAMHLPFRDGSFDGALLKDIIEHLNDPIGALVETRRVVRENGQVTIEAPRAIPRAVWADPTHVRGFTANAMTMLLTMSGWCPSTPQRIGGFPGAGRLGLLPYLSTIMRIPGLGHWFGTNWLIHGERARDSLTESTVPS